jgi:hypothetical protein
VKRVLAWTLLGLTLVAAGAAVWVRFLSGTPVGPFPGGALSGTAAETLPDDWMFANEEDYVAVESRAGMFPYSRGTWFMAYEGRVHLLLPSFFGDGLKRRLDADPAVRVRIGETLYDQVAVPLDDATIRAEMVKPFLLRQMAIEIGGAIRPAPPSPAGAAVEMWVYRLDDPPGP